MSRSDNGIPGVVIVGGGFAGLAAARALRRAPVRITLASTPPPFHYFDKGNMAVVGKGFAILQSGKFCLSGFLAWVAWAAIHLQFLATTNLRVSVLVQWIWTHLTGQRGSRLIVNHHASPPRSEEAR